uniref:Uncharacterized protein n=1 Tax=Anguilla anguilla TaxID=7936 RepID=A0A0E9SA01_ANGAN
MDPELIRDFHRRKDEGSSGVYP